jgi:ferrochelatase
VSGRLAVVLFNLGGPDRPETVRPFLFNLFSDPAIIGAPAPIRLPLAAFIAWRRAPTARSVYAMIGGRSPLLEETRAQADALERVLTDRHHDARCFVSMRYWHPFAEEAARSVMAWAPDLVVLLPLYPQFSTTTTASAATAWQSAAASIGLAAPTRTICCYPTAPGFVAAYSALIRSALASHAFEKPPRLLFSAHGLPQRIVDRGDPYPWQVEQSVAAIVSALDGEAFDHVVCYQSRVGPLTWIGPSTEAELERAGHDGVAVIVVPIAFVSEHVETLVELDREYAERAVGWGIPAYIRVPTVGTSPAFIEGLADVIVDALAHDPSPQPPGERRSCPSDARCCPCRVAGSERLEG